MKTLFWLRTDLRTFDHEALSACLRDETSTKSDVVFVFAETLSLMRAGEHRRRFVQEAFDTLRATLTREGFQVIQTPLRFAEYLQSLLVTRVPQSVPSALYYTRECAWEERQEETHVHALCAEHEIPVHAFGPSTLIAEEDLPFTLEQMPFVFTDFRKRIEAKLSVRPPVASPLKSDETPALARLRHYLWGSHAVQTYKDTRNGMIRLDDSSKFSSWLSVGALSARTIYAELKNYESQVCANESTYWLFFELLWRDYFKFFSLKFGAQIFTAQGVRPGKSPNRNDHAAFERWCRGETSDDFINANLNELNSTGWMSNRGRQNVASFLIHDLGVNWTWGAAYFEQQLIDYDPDLNWGNWLYLAGRGSDPRARKFNTEHQAQAYDPQGEYRRKWKRERD
jgi:deoxyribodipyrimidine photo-lyase